MNNLKQILNDSKDISQFATSYFDYLHQLLSNLDKEAIVLLWNDLQQAREEKKTVFIAGNGGSAATASHIGNDMGLAVQKVGNTGSSLKVMALTDNISLMTAIGNDDGYDSLFVNQLKIHFEEGDRLIVISASGNSNNLVNAAKWVKKEGGSVVGWLGFDGGKLKDLCDIVIIAETPKGEYGPVEDVHMILDHMMTSWLYKVLAEEMK
jgi:D-sedoheptulose 7-phosphate isomerase